MPNARGRGRGAGGMGRGSGFGKGRGMGLEGNCVCLKCGFSTTKKANIPCLDERCPSCGITLVREGGEHYIRGMKNKNKEV